MDFDYIKITTEISTEMDKIVSREMFVSGIEIHVLIFVIAFDLGS